MMTHDDASTENAPYIAVHCGHSIEPVIAPTNTFKPGHTMTMAAEV